MWSYERCESRNEKKNNKKQSDHALYIYRHSSQAYVTIQVGTLLVAIILIG